STIGIGAKRDRARADIRYFFYGIYDRHIGIGLIFKNAQVCRTILRYRAITIEMVRSEVEPETDGWMKGANRFQLERAHLHREHVECLLLAHLFGQRFPNISAGNRSLAASIQRLDEQFGSCRFAVRAGDRDDRNFFAKAPTEFELPDDVDSAG